MLKCQGTGCTAVLSAAAAEDSSVLIAAQIPIWIVKRPERRARYARRVFGPRCEACREKVIKGLRA
jgi:hypothetical protein